MFAPDSWCAFAVCGAALSVALLAVHACVAGEKMHANGDSEKFTVVNAFGVTGMCALQLT